MDSLYGSMWKRPPAFYVGEN
ncbi:hypothetical protein N7519_003833 [Penicillium mononematosum]|nr:hypothetical protein N7519_003833 [Penicillium mononematosum]